MPVCACNFNLPHFLRIVSFTLPTRIRSFPELCVLEVKLYAMIARDDGEFSPFLRFPPLLFVFTFYGYYDWYFQKSVFAQKEGFG